MDFKQDSDILSIWRNQNPNFFAVVFVSKFGNVRADPITCIRKSEILRLNLNFKSNLFDKQKLNVAQGTIPEFSVNISFRETDVPCLQDIIASWYGDILEVNHRNFESIIKIADFIDDNDTILSCAKAVLEDVSLAPIAWYLASKNDSLPLKEAVLHSIFQTNTQTTERSKKKDFWKTIGEVVNRTEQDVLSRLPPSLIKKYSSGYC